MLLYPNTIGQPLTAWLCWNPKKISSLSLPCQEYVTENCLFCTLSAFCAPFSRWWSKHMLNNTFHFCLCFSVPPRKHLIRILSKGAWSRSRSCPRVNQYEDIRHEAWLIVWLHCKWATITLHVCCDLMDGLFVCYFASCQFQCSRPLALKSL